MLQATQVHVHYHPVEKLKSLQNAVLNSALQIHPDEDEMLMFLNYIDIFTRLASEDTFVSGIKKVTLNSNIDDWLLHVPSLTTHDSKMHDKSRSGWDLYYFL